VISAPPVLVCLAAALAIALLGFALLPPPGGTGSRNRRDLVMLGDSLTYRGNWSGLLARDDVLNRGVDGDTTADMLGRLPAVLRRLPRACFIMGGINDISRDVSIPEIERHVALMVQRLREGGVRPVLQSTLYVSCEVIDGRDINGRVAELNRRLIRLAKENGVEFVDLNGALCDDRGLKPAYTVDGVHLSAAGYRTWAARIAPLVARTMGTTGTED